MRDKVFVHATTFPADVEFPPALAKTVYQQRSETELNFGRRLTEYSVEARTQPSWA